MAIKADATLVGAAFKEGQTSAMADVPNMKPVIDSVKTTQKTYMDTITGVMDQLEEQKKQEDIDKENLLKGTNDLAKGVYSALYDGGEPLPSMFIDAFTERVEELQDEFEKVNTEGKGDTKANAKKRREINGELARLKNEATNVRKNFMISTQDPDKYNVDRIKQENINPLNSIFGLWKDPNNTPQNITSKIVNSKLQITTGDRNWTSEDIVNALNYKDANNDNFINKFTNDGGAQGVIDAKVKGAANTPNYTERNKKQDSADLIAWFEEDPNRFDDLVPRGVDGLNGDIGLKKAIRRNPNISIATINSMFSDDVDLFKKIQELDIAGGENGGADGVINSEDIKGLKGTALTNFNKNWNIVANAILDSEDENFSKEVSYPIVAEYYADFKSQSYNKSYQEQWKKSNPTQVTNALSADQKRYYDAQAKIEDQNLARAKENRIRGEKQQATIDEQNTVYSIENEFSAGETTIGTGSRYAVKAEDGWDFYEDDKLIKNISLDSPDILDEITKHVTNTAGKHGTFLIGVSEKDFTKDGVTTTYVYAGNGKWSPKK